MTDDAADSIELSEDEVAAVGDVVASYARAVPAGREQPYLALQDAVLTGRVGGADLDVLQQVCVLALQTGQARRLGLAEVETLVSNVYRRTPDGRARTRQLRDVNDALAQLSGQQLRSATLNSTRPGRYTLTLHVSGFGLTVVLTADGLEVQSLAAG
jgi:hypothetical protein